MSEVWTTNPQDFHHLKTRKWTAMGHGDFAALFYSRFFCKFTKFTKKWSPKHFLKLKSELNLWKYGGICQLVPLEMQLQSSYWGSHESLTAHWRHILGRNKPIVWQTGCDVFSSGDLIDFLDANYGRWPKISDRFSDFSGVFRLRTYFRLSAIVDFGLWLKPSQQIRPLLGHTKHRSSMNIDRWFFFFFFFSINFLLSYNFYVLIQEASYFKKKLSINLEIEIKRKF